MAPVVVTKVALVIAQQAKKPTFWVILGIILLIPIMLVVFVVYSLIGAVSSVTAYFNDGLEIYETAAKKVAESKSIQNSISPFLIKSIYLSQYSYDASPPSVQQAIQFIEQYFVEEIKNVVLVPVVKDESISVPPASSKLPGKPPINEFVPLALSVSESSIIENDNEGKSENIEYIEKIEYEYRFFTVSQIFDIAKKPPFSIPLDELQFVCALSFTLIEGSVAPGNYQNPVVGVVSSLYGERTHPITGNPEFHYGIDIAAAWHAPVFAITEGTVYRIGSDSEYGNSIMLKHQIDGQSFYAFYAHLSRIDVKEGQEVSGGQAIGLEGGQPGVDPNPGNTTGHHLHFEIRLSPSLSSHTNPLGYILGY